LAFALGIGPVVHVTIPRLAMRPAEEALVSAADQYR
jgi:hypothetical protein